MDAPIASQSLDTFLSALASRAPTPGGGSASAVVGAVAAGLCAMVGRLNDKRGGTPGPLHDTIARADALVQDMKRLADEDVAAFQGLMASWKLPDDDPAGCEQKLAATVRAIEAPLAIMAGALDILRLAAEGRAKSKKNCVSDAICAGHLAFACLASARQNVLINTATLREPDSATRYDKEACMMEDQAKKIIHLIIQ